MTRVDPGTWDVFGDIAAITRWLDRSNANMDPNLDESMRIMKIGEEFGEVVTAYVGYTGQNPRKGRTHERADVLAELADVAITALCAMYRFTQDADVTRAVLASKVAAIMDRSNIRNSGPQPVLYPQEAQSGPQSAVNTNGVPITPVRAPLAVAHTVGACACPTGWHPAEAFAPPNGQPRTSLIS